MRTNSYNFLRLNENYDHVRNQILLMDPLPSINRAYSMVLRVEKQREIHNVVTDNFNMTIAVTTHKGQNDYGKTKFKKKGFIKKEDRLCTYCNSSGTLEILVLRYMGILSGSLSLNKKKEQMWLQQFHRTWKPQ